MTPIGSHYMALVRAFPLQCIGSDAEYDRAREVVDSILNGYGDDLRPDEIEYINVLITLCNDYQDSQTSPEGVKGPSAAEGDEVATADVGGPEVSSDDSDPLMLLTVAEVASLLRLSTKSVRRFIDDEVIAVVRMGRRVLITREAVAEFIKSRTIAGSKR